MQLLTIADLQRPQSELEPLIKEAHSLGARYHEFIKHDNETYRYEVVDYSEDSRSAGFHASELSGCFRRLVYSICGTQKQISKERDVNMVMRFRLGTAAHAMVQSDLKRMSAKIPGLYFQDEVEITPELHPVAKTWDIHSHTDGLFTFSRWYPNYGMWASYLRVALEIKTQSDKDYENTRQPKDDHLNQICVYMKCLDVPLAWVLYYNKSNSNITTPYSPWLVQFDAKRWDKLEAKMTSALEHRARGHLPEKEEGKPCGWCPYAWHCQPAYMQKRQKWNNGTQVSPGMLVAANSLVRRS